MSPGRRRDAKPPPSSGRRGLPLRAFHRPLSVVLLASLLMQLAAPLPAAQAAPVALGLPGGAPPLIGDLLDPHLGILSWPSRIIAGFVAKRPVAADPAGMSTHDTSLSTPWAAFQANVNAVAGNVVYQQTDISIPSIGYGTTVTRTYNSAAADRRGAFGNGWFWTYGVQVIAATGTAVVVREDGRANTYTLSAGTYTPPPGVYDQLVQNPDTTYTLTRKDQVRYTFSGAGRLQQVVDLNGNTLTVGYNGSNPSSLTDTAGRTWTLQTDGSGRITSITDPANRTVGYQYTNCDLTRVTDPLTNATQYGYDGAHRLTRVTDGNNHATQYVYDGAGRVVTVIDQADKRTTVAYDTAARRTTFTAPLTRTRGYTYDASNRMTVVTDALGRDETSAWDASNNRTSATDRNGGITQYAYDSRGNVLTQTDARNGQTVKTYDSGNRPLTRRDASSPAVGCPHDAAQ